MQQTMANAYGSTFHFRLGFPARSVMLLAVAAFAQLARAESFYEVGRVGDDLTSYGASVANNGTATGRSGSGLFIHAYRWTPTTGIQDLGTLGGPSAFGRGISADGSVIVGNSRVPDSTGRAFSWRQGTGMVNLGLFGNLSSTSAQAVSYDGSVIVGVGNLDVVSRPFLYRADTGMVPLGNLGTDYGFANGVSGDGSVVVGASALAGNAGIHAFRWTEATGIQSLGTLGGNRGDALAASQDGAVIVGVDLNAANLYQAFRWTSSEGMVGLPSFGGSSSVASAITANGMSIVGDASYANGAQRASLWDSQGNIFDLNARYAHLIPAGWVLTSASGISPNGRFITGTGANARGIAEAWVIDTVPEPTSVAVLAGGLLAIIRSRRKRT